MKNNMIKGYKIDDIEDLLYSIKEDNYEEVNVLKNVDEITDTFYGIIDDIEDNKKININNFTIYDIINVIKDTNLYNRFINVLNKINDLIKSDFDKVVA